MSSTSTSGRTSKQEWRRRLEFAWHADASPTWHRVFHLAMKAGTFCHRKLYHRLRIAPHFDSIADSDVILEIGGGYNPTFVKGRNRSVYHLDHLRTEELREKYAADPNTAHLVNRIQHVDFVATGAPLHTLIPAGLKFDVVFSSHSLEHQVDLISHLQSVENVLKPGGRLMMFIPDYRCCFDGLRFPTVTADALIVHMRKPRVHHARQVFDSASRSIDLNPGRRLRGADYAVARFTETLETAFSYMMQSERSDAEYRDTHAWTFCPASFELLMLELCALGLTALRPEFISGSYGNQFCAVLRPAADAAKPGVDAQRALARKRMQLCRKLMQ